jgi:aryl-alcohol dehydrogenase-like predicted oxidoreductase
VLPAAERYGMGMLVWGPLGQGMLTERARKGRETDLVRSAFFKAIHDERRLDAVERLFRSPRTRA